MKLSSTLLMFIILCAGCVTNQSRATDVPVPAPAATQDNLVRQPSFTNCELQAFISLSAGRNAISFGATQTALLAARGNGAFQVSMINELFARMSDGGFRDYPMFAAEKFYQCTDREGIPVAKNLNGAAVCLARQDISFYLYARKLDGRTQAEATAIVKRMFANSSQDIYPEALIDQTALMVYRADNDNDFYEIRRFSFETCLFPDEWKAWWNSQHAAAR